MEVVGPCGDGGSAWRGACYKGLSHLELWVGQEPQEAVREQGGNDWHLQDVSMPCLWKQKHIPPVG